MKMKITLLQVVSSPVPPAPPMYQPPAVVQPIAAPICPMGCKRNCFTYCPRDCCGVAGKRDKVIKHVGSGNEETADQAESDQKDSVNASHAVEQNEEGNNDAAKHAEDNEQVGGEQTMSDGSQEGSSESRENDD